MDGILIVTCNKISYHPLVLTALYQLFVMYVAGFDNNKPDLLRGYHAFKY